MQTGKPDKEVAGSAAIPIDGLQQGKPSSLSFAQVAPPGVSAWHTPSGTFRTTTNPSNCRRGSSRRASEMEIHSGKDRDPSHSFRQAFVWKAQGMSVETEAAQSRGQG